MSSATRRRTSGPASEGRQDRDERHGSGLERGDDRDREQDRDRDRGSVGSAAAPDRLPRTRAPADRRTHWPRAARTRRLDTRPRPDPRSPSVPVWANGLANANPRTSNGVAALVNRSIRDSAVLRTDNVVRIAVGMSWTAPTATPMNPNAGHATDRRDPWRRRDQDDDRGQAGQEPDVRVTGERLDPPQDARDDQPARGSAAVDGRAGSRTQGSQPYAATRLCHSSLVAMAAAAHGDRAAATAPGREPLNRSATRPCPRRRPASGAGPG